MRTADEIDKRGVNRTARPNKDLFTAVEVSILFDRGLLWVSRRRKVINRGLLAEPHEDPWNAQTCPGCGLRWPEVVFMAADYACRCGLLFLGLVCGDDTAAAETVWFAETQRLEQEHERD